jgi:hypothetical protein
MAFQVAVGIRQVASSAPIVGSARNLRRRSWLRAVASGSTAAAGALFGCSWDDLRDS